MRNLLAPTLLFLCLSTVLAQTDGPVINQLDSQAIDGLFADWNKPATPGASLGIYRAGKLVYAKGYGEANLEYNLSNTPTSVFRIGSTSKQFTAACIVLLEQDGKLGFNDPLRKFFPDFSAYADTITVRQLLNHTSGIRDYLQLAYLKNLREDDYYTDEDLMQWLVSQTDLNFRPGTEFTYSNSGYWLLGQIVGKVSGKTMRQFAEQRIFRPLGMKDTHFHDDHTQIVPRRASGYAFSGDAYTISMTTLDMIGDGGIFTTIEDVLKWNNAYYDRDILNEAFWTEMTRKGKLADGKEIPYAAGLFVGEYRGRPTVHHGGAFVGFRAEFLRFPEEQVGIAIFANRADANPSRLAQQVADFLLAEVLEPLQTSPPPQPANSTPATVARLPQSALPGSYEIQPGVVIAITVVDGEVRAEQTWDGEKYGIVERPDGRYVIPDFADLTFAFGQEEEGRAQLLTLVQEGELTLARRNDDQPAAAINTADYVGQYHSQELGTTYGIVAEDGDLILLIDGRPSGNLRLTAPDTFQSSRGTVRFVRTPTGIRQFRLDAGRVVNVSFVKQ